MSCANAGNTHLVLASSPRQIATSCPFATASSASEAAHDRYLKNSEKARELHALAHPRIDLSSEDGPLKRQRDLKDPDRVRNVVPRDGLEPPTRGFSVHCSTN